MNLTALRRSRRGFTLLELIVVLIVLGLLAAIAIPTYSALIAKTEQKSVESTAAAIGRNAQALASIDGIAPNQVAFSTLDAEIDDTYTLDGSDWVASGVMEVRKGDACALLTMGATAADAFTVGECGVALTDSRDPRVALLSSVVPLQFATTSCTEIYAVANHAQTLTEMNDPFMQGMYLDPEYGVGPDGAPADWTNPDYLLWYIADLNAGAPYHFGSVMLADQLTADMIATCAYAPTDAAVVAEYHNTARPDLPDFWGPGPRAQVSGSGGRSSAGLNGELVEVYYEGDANHFSWVDPSSQAPARVACYSTTGVSGTYSLMEVFDGEGPHTPEYRWFPADAPLGVCDAAQASSGVLVDVEGPATDLPLTLD